MATDFKKIQFFYYNLVDQDATVITGGSANSLFPVSNLKDPRSTKVYRSTSASDNIVFDFITSQGVDSVLVRGHLQDGFGFTGNLTIEANATNSWGSPAFSTILTPNDEFNFGYASFASQSYRYWRVSGSAASTFELADIFIGAVLESPRGLSRQFTFQNEDLSVHSENIYGQRFSDIRNNRKRIDGNLNLVIIQGGKYSLVWFHPPKIVGL